MLSLYKFQKLTMMGLKRKRELGHINEDSIAEGVYMGCNIELIILGDLS